MSQIGGCLSRLVSQYHGVGVDETEGVNDNLAFHTLNGVDDYGDGAFSECLETLLCVDVDARQPTAEARM